MDKKEFKRLNLTQTMRERFGRIKTLPQLQQMDPTDFEQFCGYLYEKKGYTAYMLGRSGDEGIDVWLERGKEKIVVQCKRYSYTVGQPVIRDLYGTMMHTGADRAALVTTGEISRQGRDWSADKPIELIDGHALVTWARTVQTNQKTGQGNNMGDSARKFALALGTILLVGACLYSLFLAWSIYNKRTTTAATPTQAVALVTEVATTEGTPTTPSNLKPTPTLIPTLTPTPTMTATITPTVSAITADNFTITRFAQPLADYADFTIWEPLPAMAVPFITEQFPKWDKTEDLTATWRMGYDADYLYGFVIVNDDKHLQPNTPQYAYYGDSIELEIDTENNRAWSAQADDYQYLFSPGDFGGVAGGAFRFRGNGKVMQDDWGSRAEVSAEKFEGGYYLAFRIPWYDLRLQKPKEGRVMGIALNINDKDQTNSPKEQEVVYSHLAGRKWSTPSTWGVMTLGR